jgi:hypothetical protein
MIWTKTNQTPLLWRKDKVFGPTPLSWAASYGYSSIVCMMRDTGGRMPLSYGAGNGNMNVVLFLS